LGAALLFASVSRRTPDCLGALPMGLALAGGLFACRLTGGIPCLCALRRDAPKRKRCYRSDDKIGHAHRSPLCPGSRHPSAGGPDNLAQIPLRLLAPHTQTVANGVGPCCGVLSGRVRSWPRPAKSAAISTAFLGVRARSRALEPDEAALMFQAAIPHRSSRRECSIFSVS
jgi:hypothetical protein